MRKINVHRAMWMALAPIGASLVAASMAGAQTTTYVNTFDTSSSFQTIANYNPPPISARFDYGGYTPTNHHSVNWSAAEDHTGNGGGSVLLSWAFNGPTFGSESAAFTMDLFPTPGYQVTDISFALMVAPGSAEDSFGGNGYFQVFTRDASYNDNATPFAEELGNPSYGGPSTNDAGTWELINIPLSDAQTRAITLQDYDDGNPSSRNIQGNEAIYIDDLSVTYLSVPEPASLGLLGASIPALMLRRRRAKIC